MARPRKLAWPAKAYRVTLPDAYENASDGLNPFERVILAFLEIEGFVSEEKLSRETCIPEDFIKGVLLRLHDKGQIDSQNKPIGMRRADSSHLSFSSAMVFRELVGGKILPYILYDTKPKVKMESTGLYCRQLRYSSRTFESVKPKDVIEALEEQRRHDKAYGDKSDLPKISSITVSESDELYYLECPIGLRTIDGEFRIGNPFGKGYSLVLEDVFMQQLDEDDDLLAWLEDWRKNLSFETGRPTVEDAEKEPYDTNMCRKLYPRLIPALRPDKYGNRNIEKIYSSIEWALFYSNERLDSKNAYNLLCISSPSDTASMQLRAAEAIGINIPEKGFPRIYELSLDSYMDEIPEMPTAFAIALLQAQSDLAHPLRKYAEKNPDVASRLFEIKKERDVKSHGSGRDAGAELSGMNESFMKEFITALLPDIYFTEEEKPNLNNNDALIDSRFKARNTLLFDVFGYRAFNTKLNSITQERLVDAERFWESFVEGDDAMQFVGDLYAAVQSELSSRIEVSNLSAKKDNELLGIIEDRAKELKIHPLPKSLSTVRLSYIRKALQGMGNSTLGGIVIAFMLSTDDKIAERALSKDKTFFADIGKIIGSRRHQNESVYFTKEEIDRFRKMTYRAIRALIES